MDPYKSVYGINFDVATELIAPGRQHLFGKCMLLPGAETGEQSSGQNLR
jgi:hypothetical protein